MTRAEAFATSIPELDRRALALAGIAEALARAGQRERAAAFAAQAGEAARSVTDPREHRETLRQVSGALARSGTLPAGREGGSLGHRPGSSGRGPWRS